MRMRRKYKIRVMARPIQLSSTAGLVKSSTRAKEEPLTEIMPALARDRRIRNAPTDAPTPILSTLGMTSTTFSRILKTERRTNTQPEMNTMPRPCCQVQMPCATRV